MWARTCVVAVLALVGTSGTPQEQSFARGAVTAWQVHPMVGRNGQRPRRVSTMARTTGSLMSGSASDGRPLEGNHVWGGERELVKANQSPTPQRAKAMRRQTSLRPSAPWPIGVQRRSHSCARPWGPSILSRVRARWSCARPRQPPMQRGRLKRAEQQRRTSRNGRHSETAPKKRSASWKQNG